MFDDPKNAPGAECTTGGARCYTIENTQNFSFSPDTVALTLGSLGATWCSPASSIFPYSALSLSATLRRLRTMGLWDNTHQCARVLSAVT